METSILAAGEALVTLADPFRLAMLASGVLMGLFLGIIPGIGGLVGMAILLPFTLTMDSYAAFAMLLGMVAVTGTSDTIPAVLFGVPGSAGAQATVMDGNPMAKKGEAGRALSAAYTASLIGGIVGAVLLALTIPVLRPVMLHVGSPELLAFSFFGIAMVATLSGSAPIRGLIAAGIGIMLSMIGPDPQTGTLRWTMGTLYLWEGLPLVPIILGFFALPELADLMIKRQAIASHTKFDTRAGMVQGVRDALQNWWLVVRGGGLGAGIGAIPGLGSSVVDWIAYGWALQSVKGADKTFGKGDVRGVLAPESANNAITAGALLPTVAFGVPGSGSMAILLGVFLIHGLVPGPEMLSTNLDFTYVMVWSVALANILGAGICFAFSGQLAKLALLRYTLILPGVLAFVYIGAFQASRSWGDLYALLIFGVLGWIMKQLKWPRPPLILGFVLGALIERFMVISMTRYGFEWLGRPLVVVLIAVSLLVILSPLRKHWRALGGVGGIRRNFGAPSFRPGDLFYLLVLAFGAVMVAEAMSWPWGARNGPVAVGIAVMALAALGVLNQIFSRAALEKKIAAEGASQMLHMDLISDHGDLLPGAVIRRAAVFFGYLLLFMGLMALIGFLPAVPLFVAVFMGREGRENWRLIAGQAVGLTGLMYLVFHELLSIPWPPTLMGSWFPVLRAIPSL